MKTNIFFSNYRCRACGFKYSEPMWDDEKSPSDDICLACNCQAGLHDWTIEDVEKYRGVWIGKGMKSGCPLHLRPNGYNPETTLIEAFQEIGVPEDFVRTRWLSLRPKRIS
jgi:hypothetical protein